MRMDLEVVSRADERMVRRAFTLSPSRGAAVVATRRDSVRRPRRFTRRRRSGKSIPLQSR
jgi:hypothetical protein